MVREVFTLFSQGYGKTAIARLLNDQGIPNPTEYKRRHGLRYRQPTKKNSTLWKYSAIADMLENEIYIGNMVQENTAAFLTRQSKTGRVPGNSGTGWRERTNRSSKERYGKKYRRCGNSVSGHLQKGRSACFPKRPVACIAAMLCAHLKAAESTT